MNMELLAYITKPQTNPVSGMQFFFLGNKREINKREYSMSVSKNVFISRVVKTYPIPNPGYLYSLSQPFLPYVFVESDSSSPAILLLMAYLMLSVWDMIIPYRTSLSATSPFMNLYSPAVAGFKLTEIINKRKISLSGFLPVL